jgi:hypothetical protein
MSGEGLNVLDHVVFIRQGPITPEDKRRYERRSERGYAHDYPFYKGLLDRTAGGGFELQEVSADKGYLGASNMLATLQRGAISYIPFKTNSVPDSRSATYGPKSQLWTRMYHFHALNRAEFFVLCHNLCVVIQSVHELGIETNFEAALPN